MSVKVKNKKVSIVIVSSVHRFKKFRMVMIGVSYELQNALGFQYNISFLLSVADRRGGVDNEGNSGSSVAEMYPLPPKCCSVAIVTREAPADMCS